MSLIKSPVDNFGSGNTKFRAIVTTAAAALLGTLVGGVSVLGIVTTVTQPPAREIRADAQPGGGAAAPPPVQAATPPPQTAPVVAERQSAPAVEGPRTVWPDALSARANHGAETAPEAVAPQQASPPANDRAALHQNGEYGAGREQSAANSAAVPARDSQPNQISPNAAPAKKRVVVSPPGQSAERTGDDMPAGNAAMGQARSDTRKSQSQSQPAWQQRSPDTTADRSGDDQAAAASTPQRRVIILPGPDRILPGPDRAASDERGHWGGGLFDFFGQSHSDGDHWNQDHWNNDWHD